jgi:hypothetical protein
MRKALLCSMVLAVSMMIYGCGGADKAKDAKKPGDKPAASSTEKDKGAAPTAPAPAGDKK